MALYDWKETPSRMLGLAAAKHLSAQQSPPAETVAQTPFGVAGAGGGGDAGVTTAGGGRLQDGKGCSRWRRVARCSRRVLCLWAPTPLLHHATYGSCTLT